MANFRESSFNLSLLDTSKECTQSDPVPPELQKALMAAFKEARDLQRDLLLRSMNATLDSKLDSKYKWSIRENQAVPLFYLDLRFEKPFKRGWFSVEEIKQAFKEFKGPVMFEEPEAKAIDNHPPLSGSPTKVGDALLERVSAPISASPETRISEPQKPETDWLAPGSLVHFLAEQGLKTSDVKSEFLDADSNGTLLTFAAVKGLHEGTLSLKNMLINPDKYADNHPEAASPPVKLEPQSEFQTPGPFDTPKHGYENRVKTHIKLKLSGATSGD